jgi:hypothetical protein
MAIQMSSDLRKNLALTWLALGYIILAMSEKPKRRHSSALFIRVTPEHEEMVKRAAELAGTSVSDWIRTSLIRTARRDIAEAARYEPAGKTLE